MNLKKSLAIAAVVSLIVMAGWEWYARSQGYIAVIDDNKALWACNYAKARQAGKSDLLAIGSSRIHFDIQLDEWEAKTGTRPFMLASDGTSPTPVFKDLVENTTFNGTILIGVAPGLFFSEPLPNKFAWRRAKVRVDHFYKRTLADRANHSISLPLERTFAFLNASEEEWSDDIDLKSMLKRVEIGNRLDNNDLPFRNFGYVDGERNCRMFQKVVDDTAFANSIIRVWASHRGGPDTCYKDTVISLYANLVNRFEARGGKVIFLRCPVSGSNRERERKGFPRGQYWDQLLLETGCQGFHFEDYETLKDFTCPEESHLSYPGAQEFTKRLAEIMLTEGVISSKKSE